MKQKTLTPVAALRAELKTRKLTGFVIPRQDEFQGEYVAPYAERLRWLTGFAGSWGMAILTLKKGAIFVDGRYTVQVRSQVDTKMFQPHHLADDPPDKWIEKNLKKGDKLGFDPWLLTANEAGRFAAACTKAGARLVPVASNPIDAVWVSPPARPMGPIATHPTQFAGRNASDKLKDVRKELAADAVVLTQPDSVSWVFNIRGRDAPHTPVVLAYAILRRRGKAELFIEPAKLPEDVGAHLKRIALMRSPADIEASLKALGKKKAKVQIDPAWAPARIHDALKKSGAKIVHGIDPCVLPKARKNAIEQEGARLAHVRDGVAMARFLYWFETESAKGGLTELSVAGKVKEFREATGMLMDLSFNTIAGAGPNAALPHYAVSEESNRPLQPNELFLIDSGAQYQDGTTDITRTLIVGEPSEQMMDCFTHVLKGMIGISRIRFPEGTCGSQLDVLARASLWRAGYDYDHGTGHGVGSYLSVHEGPARINKSDRTSLEPGMILSNEPGYYKHDRFGIRIENLVLVHEAKAISGGDRKMLGFETLTLCPIDQRLINRYLLTVDETLWLDAYHARVLKEVGVRLDGKELKWLKNACAPLG